MYPCAVWKPAASTSADDCVPVAAPACSCNYVHSSPTLAAAPPPPGPIRATRLASTVRTAPYPPVQLYNANSGIIETCRCRTAADELVAAAEPSANTSTPPMLFVPFALQANYGAHHLTAAPGSTSLNLPNGNSVSPSAVMASAVKVRRFISFHFLQV